MLKNQFKDNCKGLCTYVTYVLIMDTISFTKIPLWLVQINRNILQRFNFEQTISLSLMTPISKIFILLVLFQTESNSLRSSKNDQRGVSGRYQNCPNKSPFE